MRCVSLLLAVALAGASSAVVMSPLPPRGKSTRQVLANATFHHVSPDRLKELDSSVLSKLAQPTPTAVLHAPPTTSAAITATRFADVSQDTIASARSIVAEAHASQAAYNKYRLANPRRNNYHTGDTTRPKRNADAIPRPSLTPEVANAVKLVAEMDAKAMVANGTWVQPKPPNATRRIDPKASSSFQPKHNGPKNRRRAQSSGFWMEGMEHLGTQPFGGNSSYQVWRDVTDYGAVGDGITDDTAAINRAISDGNRCGANCLSSSVNGALVYFPLGFYLVSSPIVSYYNTQLVGAIHPETGSSPTIVAASSFTGFGVISSDVYEADGVTEWYINTSNFYRQVRNFNIDLTKAQLNQIAGIHWQVGQATSITNVEIYMTDKSTSTQVGIWGENGSGGWFSELTFSGGWYGFLGGNQQYTVSDLFFENCAHGVGLIWDWSWTWHRLQFSGCDTAIDLNPPGASSSDPVGSIYILDSDFVNCGTVINTFPFGSSEQGTTVFTFDNLHFSGNNIFISFTDGTYMNWDVHSDSTMDFNTLGDIHSQDQLHDGFFGVNVGTRPANLTEDSGFTFAQKGWVRRLKPNYATYTADKFLNAKWYAAGDGVTDDTTIIQEIIYYCAEYGYILFFPAGSYMISSPILIPPGSYIVGEVWSQLVAYGSYFADENNPQAMIWVGNGTSGNIEMQDLLFTSVGNLPGLVLVFWNVDAGATGSAAMWDCHFRVGGAVGTDLQVAQCPKLSGGIIPHCVAASILLLISPTANGYFENMWAWVADHDIDDPANTMIDVYVGRGVLIQGYGPSWFWGTASEHSVLYQYNIVDAQNVFMSMIQTESPYYQGSAATQAPEPFHLLWNGDPAFDMCGSDTTTCNVAWSIMVQHSNMVYILGAGLYSWFQNYNEDCVHTSNCQQRLINIYNVSDLWFNHIVTIGAIEVVTPALSNAYNDIVYVANVTQANVYPWWTAIATYLDNVGTADNRPIQDGWVAFGESFASGIGAGTPWDTDAPCKRGTGSYPAILNQLFKTFWGINPNFQFLACSGQRISSFFETEGKGKQYNYWLPFAGQTDIATVNFLGNDAYFGYMARSCLIGYDKSTSCDDSVQLGKDFVADSNSFIDDWFYKVVQQILDSCEFAGKRRTIIYWIGYPQFFETIDNTCDSDYFSIWPILPIPWRYAGEYLKLQLREDFNFISNALNTRIRRAINGYNRGLPYPRVLFLDPDSTIYADHRFCEPNVNEPQANADQGSVAFFYPNGPDLLPDDFTLPPPTESDAPKDWSAIESVNSATCAGDTDLQTDIGFFYCDMAQVLAEQPTNIQSFLDNMDADGANETTAAVQPDGSVTITASFNRYLKMFHPKSTQNLQIARLVTNNLRWN